MKKVLLLTDTLGLELAKSILGLYLGDATKFIGKILILKPNRETADFSLAVQPSGYEEVGDSIKAQWHAVIANYREGYEPFVLLHAFPGDKFDLLIAVDSLAAETCLAGREPGTSVKTVIVRSGPRAISPANVRAGRDHQSTTTRFLREAIYSDKAGRVDTVFVASTADRATITNSFEFISGAVPVEVIDFPVLASDRKEKQAIRSTLSLPDGGTLKPEDKVICVKLPTAQDVTTRQPNVAGLLELIFELSAATGKTLQPKWLIMCGTPGFRQAIKNGSMPASIINNVLFMGRGDAETFFDSEAMATALSASDVVVDVDRDHGYDIFLETALAWGLPVLSPTQGNVPTKTQGTALLGSTLELESTVRTLKAIVTDGQPAIKPLKRVINHTLLRTLEND